MKITYNWLKEFIDFNWTVKELSDKLTFSGIEVEAVEPLSGGDHLLDLEITPNRPDCLSLLGIARDIRALAGGNITPPDCTVAEKGQPVDQLAKLSIEDGAGCPRYLTRVITGVKVAESPGWLKEKIEKIGLRSINNVADVTNLVMYELGHPLHAFDYDKLADHTIIVRRANPNENFTTLDGVERKLTAENLVIADAKRPVALAGIMGGLESEISDHTKNVLLESAYFEPNLIRRGSRLLGLQTEASYRFERGADPLILKKAADRAAKLIAELAGGQVAAGVLDVTETEFPEYRQLTLRPEKANSLLGVDIPADRMIEILNALEIKAQKAGDIIEVQVPSFRSDIEREVDLIEEVGRIFGYDNLPGDRIEPWAVPAVKRPKDIFLAGVSKAMTGQGFSEHYGLTLTDPGKLEILDLSPAFPSQPAVELVNPISSDQSALRTILLPGLLEAAGQNLNNGRAGVRLFEMGKIFRPQKPSPDEGLHLGALLCGQASGQAWDAKPEAADFFDIKGALQFLLDSLGLAEAEFAAEKVPALHPGRSAVVRIDKKILGCCGELDPATSAQIGLRERIYYLEIDLELLMELSGSKQNRYRELPRFPSIKRDLALELPVETECRRVIGLIGQLAGGELESVSLFDLYQGKQIEPGRKSMAFSLVYRAADRTLTDAEVSGIHQKVVEGLKGELQAHIR
ncbi:MAG: phenylalanine--tRNA ligase subunit beta [Candidatus Edwardsbacteria bacterium]|nr:phenylalanine--tRNA ligase subunit beta [Candidatus Edwardsbacteria bacterium]